MTHNAKVLALLSDGKPHTHHELYALGVIAHSRVADLRKQGKNIVCWQANDAGERVSVYQLVVLPEPVDSGGVAHPSPGTAATGSGSTTGAVLPPTSRVTPADAPDAAGEVCVHPGQLTLEAA